ncbi:GM11998 [Drosophila sechellia]|uniref:GM11998 n=1 Tax=Drosophila sechellia TaxID=7238 RepID=B4IJB2_DROSE|nr:GM11998 [Drosophila sechellia]
MPIKDAQIPNKAQSSVLAWPGWAQDAGEWWWGEMNGAGKGDKDVDIDGLGHRPATSVTEQRRK